MRGRLVAVSLAVTTMVVLAFLVPLAILVRDLAGDRERLGAEQDAESVGRLLAFVAAEDRAETLVSLIGADALYNGRPIALIFETGDVVGAGALADTDLTAALAGSSVRQALDGGEAIYVPLFSPSGDTSVVAVFSSTARLTEGVWQAWIILGALGAVLVAVAIAVADRMGRSLVAPVNELSGAATRLGSGDLDTRVSPSGPEELQRVGGAFNLLAEQVARLLEREREEAADLSHRLRTPLTAARLNAEGLPDDDRKQRLVEQLDEIERVVDHVIREVRRPERESDAAPVDAMEVVAARAAFWAPLAEDEGRRFTTAVAADPAVVRVPERDLGAAIDALVGNVFAHTPSGVPLSLDGSVADGEVVITIQDGGSGYPARVSVAERGSSVAGSTGLGLDIATRTASSIGGSLELGRGTLSGARAVLRLPLTQAM